MAKNSRQGRKTILGKKVGMTQVFSEEGQFVPVTVLQAGPCVVLQVKTEDNDGYSAVQLGFDETQKKRKRPQQALFDRIGVAGQRFVREIPYVDPADVIPPDSAAEGESEAGGLAPGSRIGVGAFKGVVRVDVRGVTKGRGFAGTIKRHGFASGDKAHGSKNVRQPGSTGMHTDPGRVAKGKKMPGHLGNAWRKAMNLTVVGIEEEDNLMLVKGALPGPNGGYVYIEESLV